VSLATVGFLQNRRQHVKIEILGPLIRIQAWRRRQLTRNSPLYGSTVIVSV
jgi:hypothetical protein